MAVIEALPAELSWERLPCDRAEDALLAIEAVLHERPGIIRDGCQPEREFLPDDLAIKIERAAKRAVVVDAEGHFPAVAEQRPLGRHIDCTARVAQTEQNRLWTVGDRHSLDVVEFARQVGLVEVRRLRDRVESAGPADGAGVDDPVVRIGVLIGGRAIVGAEGDGLVHIRRGNVGQELGREHIDLRRNILERRVDATAGEGARGDVAFVGTCRGDEGREFDHRIGRWRSRGHLTENCRREDHARGQSEKSRGCMRPVLSGYGMHGVFPNRMLSGRIRCRANRATRFSVSPNPRYGVPRRAFILRDPERLCSLGESAFRAERALGVLDSATPVDKGVYCHTRPPSRRPGGPADGEHPYRLCRPDFSRVSSGIGRLVRAVSAASFAPKKFRPPCIPPLLIGWVHPLFLRVCGREPTLCWY